MSPGGITVRLMACFVLVFATWNPTGVSFLDWVTGAAPFTLKLAAGAALLLGHILFFRITWLSLGPAGLAFVVALLLAGMFTLSELDAIDLGRAQTRSYSFLAIVSVTLMIGLTWSLMKRRVTGQSNYLNPPP